MVWVSLTMAPFLSTLRTRLGSAHVSWLSEMATLSVQAPFPPRDRSPIFRGAGGLLQLWDAAFTAKVRGALGKAEQPLL